MTRQQQLKIPAIVAGLLDKPYELGKHDCITLLVNFYEPLGILLPHEFRGITLETYADKWAIGECRDDYMAYLDSFTVEVGEGRLSPNASIGDVPSQVACPFMGAFKSADKSADYLLRETTRGEGRLSPDVPSQSASPGDILIISGDELDFFGIYLGSGNFITCLEDWGTRVLPVKYFNIIETRRVGIAHQQEE